MSCLPVSVFLCVFFFSFKMDEFHLIVVVVVVKKMEISLSDGTEYVSPPFTTVVSSYQANITQSDKVEEIYADGQRQLQ